MKSRSARISLAALFLAFLPASAVLARELTFEDRVKAQEAIERVYYAHQIGATMRFEEAVPREVLERKVRTYLNESVALETYWKTPVTAEALAREIERMGRNTRLPDRLREIYSALGNDRRRILECLARPALADRLARNFFAFDQTVHGTERQKAEEMRRLLWTGEISIHEDHPLRTVVHFAKTEKAPAARDELLRPTRRIELEPDEYSRIRTPAPLDVGAVGAVIEEREAFVIRVVLDEASGSFSLATYAVPKITWDAWWALREPELHEAAVVQVEDPAGDRIPAGLDLGAAAAPRAAAPPSPTCEPGDTWNNGFLDVAPEPRTDHTAVWTGTEMIVWGGAGYRRFNSGGRYDPATDTWSAISTTNAPTGRDGHTAVWTGAEMIVWGIPVLGNAPTLGGRYNPVTDTWSPISTANAPAARSYPTAVWTGTRMIIWGGYRVDSGAREPIFFASGGRYDPSTDTWSPTSMTDAPAARLAHTAVWTGTEMIIWGGTDGGTEFNSGSLYDAATDTWSAISTTSAPEGRSGHTAVWTGTEMIVWGGVGGNDTLDSGGRYDPPTDTWVPTPAPSVPERRIQPTAVWTGTEMIVWGGDAAGGVDHLDSGERYDPATDTWTPTSTINAPAGRYGHTAIWTGSRMIVWGGVTSGPGFIVVNSGGRYDPDTDTWSPTYTTSGPAGRMDHTAVWTGSRMIVWGGDAAAVPHGSGGRYDPATDTWAATSLTNAPVGRAGHTAVWTGSQMFVWGGLTSPSSVVLNSGGRYDPIADTWSSTSTTTAPPGRARHTAVWTGTRMIVWGGWDRYPYLDSGGRYDPATDTWSATATTNAPTGRFGHTAVWTGNEMIVWGGSDGNSSSISGSRYDPIQDTWSPISTINAPTGRDGHTVVWTGTRIIAWGGGLFSNSGGLYDPTMDTWSPTSTTNAPEGRIRHTAIWTGTEMIVWGGTGVWYLDTGGLYDPARDRWSPVSTMNAPTARIYHTAVWSGDQMIVWGGRGLAFERLGSGGRYSPDPPGEPPVVDAGPDQVMECASANGTPARLHGAGAGCGALTFTWTGPFAEGGGSVQGSAASVTLPLGLSSITLRVDDSYGRSATDTVMVSVVDTMAPVLTFTATDSSGNSTTGFTVNATMPSGAVLSYSATADDACAGAVVAACAPPSGSTFPINPPGQFTTVACEVADPQGNRASGSVPVHVKGAGEQLHDLGGLIMSMHLSMGLAKDLEKKVRQAVEAIEKGEPKKACHKMKEFAKKALQESTKKKPKISADQAGQLLAASTRIQAVLDCGAKVRKSRKSHPKKEITRV